MQKHHLIKFASSTFLALSLLTLAWLTLRPVQAAPPSRRYEDNILVTTTIQAAINAAAPGDTILIPAGTYTESLTLSKAVSLTGVSSTTTIIHAIPNQRVLTITGATIDNSVVISGLTITRGRIVSPDPSFCGGGILITNNAKPLLQNMIVADNQHNTVGGGICAQFGSPLTLSNVSVISNSAPCCGGGVYAEDALTLIAAKFISNAASDTLYGGGGGAAALSSAIVIDSYFEHNQAELGQGGGFASFKSLIITNTKFLGNEASVGGGIYADENASLSDSYLADNTANSGGGGLRAMKDLTLTNATFISNSTGNYGGGAQVDGTATIFNSYFERNTANYGGGLSTFSTATLTSTYFISNAATIVGGGMAVNGLSGSPATTLTQVHFEDNTSNNTGGGLGAGNSKLTLIDTDFIGNFAADEGGYGFGGGGIWTSDGITLIRGRFEENSSTSSGGGLYAGYDLTVTGTQFLRNRAHVGGGLSHNNSPTPLASNAQIVNALFAGNTVTTTGAALYLTSTGRITLLHTTIADTGLNPKAAIAVVSGTVGITNTIITSHTLGISQTTGTVYEDYNLFFNVPTTSTGVVAHGGHSLSGDPKFTGLAGDDYHLSTGSAALDAAFPGLAGSDFEGDPRPLDTGPDIGFDESSFAPSLIITKTVAPATFLVPGQILTYTIVVSNQGQASAHNVLITDTLPASITGVSLFTYATIAAGQRATFTLTGTVSNNAPDGAVITNTAYYSHSSGSSQASTAFTVQNEKGQNLEVYLPLILKN